ncbi:MAG: crotonase/enoyl-CoA hydratase family protein [Bacteroidia bacterium]|nr:crotonase/enoyl-CoA hydratase family protein [Bacteroidia bacterium]
MKNTYSLTQQAQLKNINQIRLHIDANLNTLWLFQNPSPRPCFNWVLVDELRNIQTMLEINDGYIPHQNEMVPIEFIVLDSDLNNIFSMGGDLSLFENLIRKKNKEELFKYARNCIDAIHRFNLGCRLPITTIACVRGDAMGGGFEEALSCQVLIAEKNVEMGFPEVLFNLFPGMGGYHFLSQRVAPKLAEEMMLNGKKYNTQELYKLGVVDRLAEKGEGQKIVYEYIKKAQKYKNAHFAMKHVKERVHPISHDDLIEICKYWVEIAMNISERDLKLMKRLVNAQDKMMNIKKSLEFPEKIAI